MHHSHVIDKIHGYTHGFCNHKVQESKNFLVCWVLVLTIILWGTAYLCLFGKKKLKIGGSNLTNVNFSNLGYQLKCIDTLKHYQQRLAQPAATIKSKEKSVVKKVTRQFICQYDYFSQVGQKLSKTNQEKILDMVAAGKGVTLYEKITTCNNLDSELENKFLFEINEFYSELKQSNGSEIEYENSKFSYQTLKMRDLYDMNDLYDF